MKFYYIFSLVGALPVNLFEGEELLHCISTRHLNLTYLERILNDVDQSEPEPNAPPNRKSILTTSPEYRKSYKNESGHTIGHLYEFQTEVQKIPIVHVYGSPYNMGKAQGMLMGERIKQFYSDVTDYALDYYVVKVRTCLKELYPSLYPSIGNEIVRDLAESSRQSDLDALMRKMGPSIPQFFLDEVEGLADALDIEASYIVELHLFTEMQKSRSSFIGAWGKALMTSDTKHGSSSNHMLHARAVQWDLNGPFRNNHQITVYHPDEASAVLSIGWSGFLGAVTAVNDEQLTASTMEVSFPDSTFEYNEPTPQGGVPFVLLLRQMLHFSSNYHQMMQILREARRTRNLILGLGDGPSEWFNSVQYSPTVLNFQTDTDMRPGSECEEPLPCDWHPRFTNVVYHKNDWNSPKNNRLLGDLIDRYYGKISYRNMITDILARSQSGRVQSAVFDVADEKAYVAFSRPSGHENAYAYLQAYNKLDIRSLFDLTACQVEEC